MTFPKGFPISKNVGHPTSGSGGKKTFKRYLKSEQTHTHKHTYMDKSTYRKHWPIGPTLCHQSLAIGAACQVSQLSGPGLVVMCRLRPGWDQSTVCICQGRKAVWYVQWSYRVESSLRLYQISFKKILHCSHLKKNHNFGSFGYSWCLLWGFPWLLLVSAATLTHVEFKL